MNTGITVTSKCTHWVLNFIHAVYYMNKHKKRKFNQFETNTIANTSIVKYKLTEYKPGRHVMLRNSSYHAAVGWVKYNKI